MLMELGGPVGALGRLSQYSEHDGHVFDVGVNKGTIARHLIRIFPNCPAHLFEPLPEQAETLAERFKEIEGLRVVQCALSNTTGSTSFNVADSRGTSSLFSVTSEDSVQNHPEAVQIDKTMEVTLDTVDGYCQANDIKHISCMKLDVQGAELLVLQGAEKMLESQSIDMIMLEWFAIPHYDGAPLLADTWQYLDSKNYAMYDIFPGRFVKPTRQRRFGDAVFISKRFQRDNLERIEFGK